MSIADETPTLDLSEPDDSELVPGFNFTHGQLKAELRLRCARKIQRAYDRQYLAAKINGERRTFHTREGGGEVTMQIDPFFYHYFGRRYGYDCWDSVRNPEFTREILRDNPECRVKNHIKAGLETRAMAANKAPVSGRRGRWAL